MLPTSAFQVYHLFQIGKHGMDDTVDFARPSEEVLISASPEYLQKEKDICGQKEIFATKKSQIKMSCRQNTTAGFGGWQQAPHHCCALSLGETLSLYLCLCHHKVRHCLCIWIFSLEIQLNHEIQLWPAVLPKCVHTICRQSCFS